jgi:OmcA/MtrC family decaheme c-type cytochrome
MNTDQNHCRGFFLVLAICALAVGVAGCTGDTGAPGAAGAPGPGVAPLATATALNITITGASVHSAPVVKFKVTNQDGVAVAGLADTDLRFNIAKLVPGSNGNPSNWQNYIYRASGGVYGNQERKTTSSGYRFGTLVDHKDGTYTYTFATNITNPADVVCPSPCTDADGIALDLSYQAGLTHRISIQQGNSVLPKANATYDFVPAGGAVTFTRDIVQTAKCNECHNQLVAHGSRIETKLCVTCHNRGSWVAGTAGVTPNTPVDFKVYIHKIHRGDELPSVLKGTPYMIGTADFSDVAFPQDIRNCTKCHDGAVTAQGDNWKNQPSKAACGSCHDDVYFGTLPDPLKSYQTVSHIDVSTAAGAAAPADPTDDMCVQCHGAGQIADVVVKHTDPVKAIAAKFKFNIVSVTGGTTPAIQFSVTDPTNGDAPYDIKTDPAFIEVPSGVSRIALVVGWNQLGTADLANTGSGVNPAQPITVFPTPTCGGPASGAEPASADWSCSGPVAGVYTLTKLTALPAGAAGTGRVGFEGHPAGMDAATGLYTIRVPVKSVVKDWSIDGSTLKARRAVVDIARCDKCHDQLSLHGSNRTDEPQICVMCHNPNDTDANRRPKNASGILDGTLTADGLPEQAIDFKRMIHSIHGAAMRENKFVVYGFGGSVNDFSGLRFPGILNDCMTCHTTKTVNRTTYGTYELVDTWETPTENGILGSTIRTTPNAVDAGTYATGLATPDDDLNITPTAAVCSSCHDGALQKQHMTLNGAVFSATQTDITTHTAAGGYETCAICHGPGTVADVKVVHGVK